MKALVIINLVVTLLSADTNNSFNALIKKDKSLIIPGTGAENILLGQSADEILSLKGYPDRISDPKGEKELFNNIFKVNGPVKIFFDKIFYYNFEKAIFFINSNKVSAIAGLNAQRITIDSVDLSKGAEYFIFSYGNTNLNIITKQNGSKDVLYIFADGIAIVDDKGDDKIDMYIVFPAGKK